MAELKKIGFTPSLQTNASAPDPQKINDLQVRHAALILDHNSTTKAVLAKYLSVHRYYLVIRQSTSYILWAWHMGSDTFERRLAYPVTVIMLA